VLTNTQLSRAKTSELKRLKARIEAELANRHQQHALSNTEATSGKDKLFYSALDGH